MVPGRSYQADRRSVFSADHTPHGIHACASCQPGDIGRLSAHHGVRIDASASRRRQFSNGGQMGGTPRGPGVGPVDGLQDDESSVVVLKKTTFVVYGEKAGSKLTKAQKLEVGTLNEQEFEALLQGS